VFVLRALGRLNRVVGIGVLVGVTGLMNRSSGFHGVLSSSISERYPSTAAEDNILHTGCPTRAGVRPKQHAEM